MKPMEIRNNRGEVLIHKRIENPETQIKAHLFIISPNNSGSTLLKNLLATSANTWNLVQEGKNTFGYVGPNDRELGIRLMWASTQQWIDFFQDTNAYDWKKTKKSWYFQAFAKNKEASVFVEKSPPFLLNVSQLNECFFNPKFIFLLRNPYSTIEGIIRRYRKKDKAFNQEIVIQAANHVLNCFRLQKENIKNNHRNGIFISYESLCDKPYDVENKIKMMAPELKDLNLYQKVGVKGRYYDYPVNMNNIQIIKLSAKELKVINTVFEKGLDLFGNFGYSLMK